MKNKFSKSDIPVIKWIYSVCKPQTPWLIAMVILNIFHGSITVFFANFSKKVIDAATVDKSIDLVIKYSIALVGVIAVQMIFYVLKNAVSEFSKGKLIILIQRHILSTLMKKDYSQVTHFHTGELQNRMFNDANVVTEGFMNIIPNTVFFITKLLSAFIYLVVIDRFFAIIFLVGGIFVFLVTRIFRKTIKRLHRSVQETEGRTRSFVQEVLTNLLVFKAFSAESKAEEKTGELQDENFKAKMKRRNFSILANAGLNTTFSLGAVFAVAFGAWSIIFKGTTYGTVTAMIQLVNQIQTPFASLSSVIPQYFTLIASAERLMELDNISDEVQYNENNIDVENVYNSLKYIDLEKISFKYDRDVILDETSFRINKGDFVAIMGISGIGKSTLLKLLLGVYKPQSGSIKINADREYLADKCTRKLFSYVPQGNMLISGTIRDNITFLNENAGEEEIEKAIDISCSRKFIDELPDGIDTIIGEKGLGLSEGQVQRLAIARSLLSNSPIILLDEATSALDEETEKQFLSNLRELSDVSCIIVSHKFAAREICNRHIHIDNGKIVEE